MPATQPSDLGSSPLAAFREGRLVRRLLQLYLGLLAYGVSMGMVVRAELGVIPWDVFHQGVALRTPLSLGTVVIIVSLAVLLAWIPLRQLPGLGTISNAVVIGLVLDAFLAFVPAPQAWPLRIGFLVGGVVLNGLATAAYIGARFGPGPRDGLMTGLVRVSGRSIRLVRTALEVLVVAIGWLLGGMVGVGTVLYALAIGPLVHAFLPLLAPRNRRAAESSTRPG